MSRAALDPPALLIGIRSAALQVAHARLALQAPHFSRDAVTINLAGAQRALLSLERALDLRPGMSGARDESNAETDHAGAA